MAQDSWFFDISWLQSFVSSMDDLRNQQITLSIPVLDPCPESRSVVGLVEAIG